jgi:hypothetical protein
MSALGQKRTSERDQIMSALPPKADIGHFAVCTAGGVQEPSESTRSRH